MATVEHLNGALATVALGVGCAWVKYWWNGNAKARIVAIAEKQLRALVDEDVVEIDEVLTDVGTHDKPKRKIRKRGLFRNHLIQIGKAKFGCPTRTGANLLCVRKYLYDACVEHGLITRHIAMNLDFAVEAVFVPSTSDILARAVSHTKKARSQVAKRNLFGGPTPTA